MSAAAFVRYRDDIEQPLPDETRTIDEIVRVFAGLQRLTFEKHRHAVRGAHAKSHGVLRGELTVLADLDEPLAQGLFAAPATYPVIVRLSTSIGDVLPDGVATFRGVAIKVLGVSGPRLLAEPAGARTQDLTFINHPFFPTGDAAAFLAAQRRMARAAHLPEELQETLTNTSRLGAAVVRSLGIADPAGILGQAKPHAHPLGVDYFTAAAMRHGAYVAKLAAVPTAAAQQPLRDTTIDVTSDSAITESVQAYFAAHDAAYELRAQLCTSLDTMPVEDASVRWSEDESPYRPVARLHLPAQDPFSDARRVYADEVLAFSPWNGLAAHRPLGSLMRSRLRAYEASSAERHARNVRARVEPERIEELPE